MKKLNSLTEINKSNFIITIINQQRDAILSFRKTEWKKKRGLQKCHTSSLIL